jgi:ribosome-binding protein aMBF1 (putative translation factor)
MHPASSPTHGSGTSDDRTDAPTTPRRHRLPELLALGAAVRELRARRGWSQEFLGFRADVHRNYVGAIERGEMNITFRVLLKLAYGLCVPLSELIAVYERQRAARGEAFPSPEPAQR